MLTHLSINNYTLVDHLDLELDRGMTVITGETGAGKSILLDALGLALGDKADPDRVRNGEERADINASFDIDKLKEPKAWLAEHDLSLDGECILRRVITKEGRSRGYINGQPVALAQLKNLGEMLIDIHAQHEHQSLLKKDTQRTLVDEYAGHEKLADEVKSAFHEWQSTHKRFNQLKDNAEESSARLQLLSYQVDELNQLDLQQGEIETLEAEQKQLSNGEAILHDSYQVAALCGGEEQNIIDYLNRAIHIVSELPQEIPAIKETTQLLSSALIQVEEAQHEIERHIDSFNLDPERLHDVEERLSAAFEIARKHRVKPAALIELHNNLRNELQEMSGDDGDLELLEEKVKKQQQDYLNLAQKLSSQRQTAGEKLAKAVNQQLHKLAMEHAKLKVELQTLEQPNAFGTEEIQLLISTNPGQPMKPLGKIASGGELSRISLAIQVVTAQTSSTPTLVFDEVDVGIGGATADVVGQLLRKLGEKAQIICVTHLAQVAGKGHFHLRVNKQKKGNNVSTSLEKLSQEEKIEEIARMIGNDKVTQASLEHAREMIA